MMARHKSVYTVISSRRTGKHGSEQKWFGSREEAGQHARFVLSASQLGRNWRKTNCTEPLQVYVAQVLDVVEVAAQPVTYRKVNGVDIKRTFFRQGDR